ncbi:MAG TPA: M3 family metallopeptidase, partial [Brumimicrobium sp.]|nr:M3 family metallopeptidase [Brumimicrobium sp.]
MNSLKQDFSTPYSTAPFSKIKNEDFLPAIEEGIETAKKEIQEIIDNPEAPNFKNTLEAMAYSGMHLDRITSIFFNLHSAETNDELENIAQEVAPKLSEFSNDITLNPALFQRIKTVYDQKDKLTLTPEQEMLLVSNYKSFVRNGALLNEEEKQKLREIMNELSTLTLTFGKNVLVEQNAYQLHLTNEKDGEGLPQGIIEAAAELAKAENKEGWIFTLDYPSYIPFMKFAKNRELRKELAIANGKKAFQNNENNNEKVAIRIAQLRFERAKLLGYETHAHFVLEERMAESPHKVNDFLNDLLVKSKPAALAEFKELEEFAKELDGIDRLEKWDSAYYANLLKQKRFNLDDELLKPYFKLENVLNGAFEVSNRLFGLRFQKVDTI